MRSACIFHYSVDINSNNMWCVLLDSLDDMGTRVVPGGNDTDSPNHPDDDFGLAPNGWQEWLRADSFNALLHGRALQQFAAAHPAFCDDCPLVATCQGGCKAAAEVCFGDARRCDPFLLAYRDQAHKPRGPAQG